MYLFGDMFGNYFFTAFGTFVFRFVRRSSLVILLHFTREEASDRPLVLRWQRNIWAGRKKKSDIGGENKKKELHER